MDIKSQLHMWQLIIVWMWFEQAFKADVVAVIYEGPASQRIYSISEANLMFEFLLGGVELDQDNNIVLLDKELASMRQGRAFLALINDNIPRTRSSMEEMLSILKDKQKKPLSQKQFQSLVLSMVFSAHQARRQERRDEQMAWGQILIQLANVTTNELRGQYLINYV